MQHGAAIMDKTRIPPPDPVEAAQVPVEGVDLPAGERAGQGATGSPTRNRGFPENDGLVKPAPVDPADVDLTTGAQRDAASQAAQRGRTA
jgi:hypothetical protein